MPLNTSNHINITTSQSTFLSALFVLVVINLSGLYWQHNFNRHTGAAKSTNALIDSFTALQKSPNIVLLGSSLIKTPFWLSDMHYLAKTLDYDTYYGCQKLENQLSDRDLKSCSVFDFGMPGAMVSDVYLLAEKLFHGPHTPKLVIYALGPRDFNDRVITSEITTPTFDRLFSATDLVKTNWPYKMNFEQRANFLLDRYFFAYRKRGQWQASIANGVTRALDIISPKMKQSNSNSNDLDFINTNNYKLYASIDPRKQSDICWKWSIKDYKARYASFNEEQFNKQLSFLKALIATSRSRNIELLLVSMPLTKQNIELMPGPLHSIYAQTLRSVAHQYQTPFIDLQNDQQFDQSCFYDTAHLNHIGGDKLSLLFSDLISDVLYQSSSQAPKMRLSEGTHASSY